MKNPGNAWEIPGNMVNQGKHLKSWEITGYFSSNEYFISIFMLWQTFKGC